MATYKVIQDIEADDKLLGPLTLRQFIYAVIVIVSGFAIFKLVLINPLLALPLLPHTILLAILAAPIGKDQSPEVWLLAKIRFFLKPRKRIWDQSGIKELVTITAPKKVEKVLTDNLSQTEVRSRLEALANTIDSRGWAVKNVNVNLFAQPSYVLAQQNSDRLIDPSSIPQEVPTFDVQATEDIYDERSNPVAQNLDQMINASAQAHRQQIVQNMQNPGATQSSTADYWFLNQPQGQAPTQQGYAMFDNSPIVRPGSQPATTSAAAASADEEALLDKIHKNKSRPDPAKSHLKTIIPLSEQKKHKKKTKVDEVAKTVSTPVTPQADPAILELANNDDLNVATIAREAKRKQEPPADEVVISLR